MDCRRAEELFSDHLEGELHTVLRAELEAHLSACDACPALRAALDEVVEALHAVPRTLEPAGDLAERVAGAALRARRVQPLRARFAVQPPVWLQAAAAALALATSAGVLYAIESPAPARAATRLLDRTATAGVYLLERKDRLVEDVRILRVVIRTAFEGRLDRMNERVEDYRRLLEKRRAQEEPSKSGGGPAAAGSEALARHEGIRTTPRSVT
jgi:anti-sigma factor RsiW